VARALTLLDDGADLLDLGAESTRPGSNASNPTEAAVSAEEEQERLLRVIEGTLKAHPAAILSADTYKSATARAALAAGVEVINDVSGFTWDEVMSGVCAESGCGVVLMHTRGRPDEWRTQAKLTGETLIETIRAGLSESLALAARAGIAAEAIVLDPGYGFGKKFDENYTVLAHQDEFLALGRPLLAGVSRKSFLGHTLAPLFRGDSAPVESREIASIAAMVTAILHGASIIRVHEVRPAVEAARIADAVLAAH
jgi:dihydropteroate synthase